MLTIVIQNVFQRIDVNDDCQEWLLITVFSEDSLRMFLTVNIWRIVDKDCSGQLLMIVLKDSVDTVVQNQPLKITSHSNLLEWLLTIVVKEDCLRMLLTVILSEISKKIDWKELLEIVLRNVVGKSYSKCLSKDWCQQ